MGTIYRRETLKKTEQVRKKEDHSRTRNVIMNFRVTQEEKELIERRIRLSGISKSDYFISSCLHQTIHTVGNIKTFSAMKESIQRIENHLPSVSCAEELDIRVMTELRTVLEILNSVLKEDI